MVHLGQVATMVVLLAREGAAGAQDVRARHGYSGVGGGGGWWGGRRERWRGLGGCEDEGKKAEVTSSFIAVHVDGIGMESIIRNRIGCNMKSWDSFWRRGVSAL
jgi:hypothetical protein